MPTAAAKTSVAEEPPLQVEVLQKDGPQEARLLDPGNFINRELSWLEFNRRVLEEAQDPTQPLIERVKFLTIFSSNLDEFFEIRVAGIKAANQERNKRYRAGRPKSDRYIRSDPEDRARGSSQRNARFGKMNCCPSLQKTGFTCAKWRNFRQNAPLGRIVIFSRKFFQCLHRWR